MVQISNEKRIQQRYYVLVRVISSYLAKARWLKIFEYRQAAYVINSNRWLGIVREWLVTETVFKAGMHQLPKLGFWALRLIFRRFFGFLVIFILKPAVTGGSAAIVLLRCYELLLLDDLVTLLDIILLGVVDLSILALLFRGKATPWLSRFIIFSSSAELLFLLLHMLLFGGVSFKAFLSVHLYWSESSPLE